MSYGCGGILTDVHVCAYLAERCEEADAGCWVVKVARGGVLFLATGLKLALSSGDDRE